MIVQDYYKFKIKEGMQVAMALYKHIGKLHIHVYHEQKLVKMFEFLFDKEDKQFCKEEIMKEVQEYIDTI